MTNHSDYEKLPEKALNYLAYGNVLAILEDLRSKEYPVSDIYCKDPKTGRRLYFVDLVQQGGGVLGVALVGYTMALEAAGIRFLSLAGTSAGAINTVLMAGCGQPLEERSLRVLKEMSSKDFADFVDPGKRVLWPVSGLVGKQNKLVKLFYGLCLVILNLRGIWRKGLCTGDAFRKWVADVLMKYQQITTVSELIKNMNVLPEGLQIKSPNQAERAVMQGEIHAHLAIIAADITTQTKVEFPRMAELYVPEKKGVPVVEGMYDHLQLSPEDMVRASMAIPLFYRPKNFNQPSQDLDKWEKMAGYHGKRLDTVQMVDGGIMSNFPIDVFHVTDRTPTRPTFGVRLGLSRNKPAATGGLFQHAGAIFDGARNLRDFEFLFNNEDYKNLVQYIDTVDYNWLDFSIGEEEKYKLFELGVMAAQEFLEGTQHKQKAEIVGINRVAFNWKDYQSLRRRLLFFSSSDRIKSLWSKEDALRKLGLNGLGGEQAMTATRNLEPGTPADPRSFHDDLKLIEAYIEQGNAVKILWVDEDPGNDFLELNVLRALNIDFVTASNNKEAMAKLENSKELLAVVTDSNRQGNENEGLELTKLLLQEEKGKDVPVILHSDTKAKYYSGQSALVEETVIKGFQATYSPLIVGNYVDARELVMAVVNEIAGSIKRKEEEKLNPAAVLSEN